MRLERVSNPIEFWDVRHHHKAVNSLSPWLGPTQIPTGCARWSRPPSIIGSMQIADNVMYRELDDEIIFLDASAGQYFSLDGVGSHFWRLFQDGLDVTQCIEALHQEYEVDRAVLHNDIIGLTDKLKSHGILVD